MKNRLKLILGLDALLLLCGLVWWQKKPPEPAPSIPIRKDGAPPSTPASITATTPPKPLSAPGTPPQPNTVPSGNAVPKKKISEMDLDEAAAIMKEIRSGSTAYGR